MNDQAKKLGQVTGDKQDKEKAAVCGSNAGVPTVGALEVISYY